MESRLAAITDEMCTNLVERRDSDVLLSELTGLAAELEAGVAANLYRFGASRAYYEIVEERLAALSEEAVPGTAPGVIFCSVALLQPCEHANP